MATPMPRKEKTYADGKRVVVFASLEMGYLLDLISRYRCVTKRSLHEEIWFAGVRAYLGVDPEEVDTVSPLPRGSAAPSEIKKLAQALIAGS